MQQGYLGIPRQLVRILFLRGSPERILYARSTMLWSLAAAVLASAAARLAYFDDPYIFVLLWVFAKLTMFMLWMTLLTARVVRLRLANAMLCLVLASLAYDVVLLLLSPLPLGELAGPAAWLWAAAIAYGAGNIAAWALRKPLTHGLAQVAGYYAAFIGLDLAFRHLYSIMAA